MDAAPACWATFTRVLSTAFDSAPSPDVRQLVLDAYAVQHPGPESAQRAREMLGHLIGLHCALDHNMSAREIVQMIRECRKIAGTISWMAPPAQRASLTIHDVIDAQTEADHHQRVRIWATSVWKSWDEHHETIAQIVGRVMN